MIRRILFFLVTFWGVVFCAGTNLRGQSIYSEPEFEMDQPFRITGISVEGNKVTKEFIVLRELEFKAGSSLAIPTLDSLMVQSTANLKRTPLFNFVNITKEIDSDSTVHVNVKLLERWYIWPIPVFRLADRNINEWWRRRDFSRVDYGMFFHYYNFRGRNELLRLLTQFGYEELFELVYRIPYINSSRTLGIEFGIGFSNLKEISYQISEDTLSKFIDRHHFPQKNQFASLGLVYRPNFNNSHGLSLSFSKYQFADTLMSLNPKFSPKGNKPEFFNLSYKFKSDFRDQKSYPLDGYYFDAELSKIGLGLFETSPDFWRIRSDFDWYQPLNKRFYFSSNLAAMFEEGGEVPFFLEKGLGYGNTFVRGYEHYVMKGNRFALMKNNFKWAIIPQTTRIIPFLKSEKFNKIHYAVYINAFLDLGYVGKSKPIMNNTLNDKLLYGYGLGVDFVTYYDMVFRLEYSFNLFNQGGFYVHFEAPI